jgi:hypothetical protein
MVGVFVALTIVAMALALSGCITDTGTPTYGDMSLGTVRAFQPMTADTQDGQKLDEYGLFYSTNRDDVVALDQLGGNSGFDNDAVIITNPAVKQIRVLVKYTAGSGQVGTASVDAKNLTPGTTYYYRFYTIGHESGGTVWRTLFAVGSHTTSNPTLKSLKKSAGTLFPSFSKMTMNYAVTLSKSTASTKITVVPAVSGSVVSMAVEGAAWGIARSKVVSVAKGHDKVLYIRVIAPDGMGVVYSVKVIRKK